MTKRVHKLGGRQMELRCFMDLALSRKEEKAPNKIRFL